MNSNRSLEKALLVVRADHAAVHGVEPTVCCLEKAAPELGKPGYDPKSFADPGQAGRAFVVDLSDCAV